MCLWVFGCFLTMSVGFWMVQNLNIVCRLGGSHLPFSFLGSIGTLMAGSGLANILEEIFAHNVIQYIMSGKAYAPALHGHLLIYAALQKLIFDDMVKELMEILGKSLHCKKWLIACV